MKRNDSKLTLKSYDDIFKTDEQRAEDAKEKVTELPLEELFPFPEHPFRVLDDDAMRDTAESVKQYGVLVPAIVRPREDGGYEIVSGHRRHRACELAGLETMPCIIRNMDDDAATIIMVDSNLQRENILPSERAKAYKMKLEALKHQGKRIEATSRQIVGKLESSDLIGNQTGESGRQVQRFVRLNELAQPLLEMVDDKKIAFNPAVELSYLKPKEQELLLTTMESEQATPSVSQAKRLKKFSQEGHLTEDSMLAIMSEEKKDVDKLTLSGDTLKKYFPHTYTPQQIEDTIIKLLEQWQKKRQREQER